MEQIPPATLSEKARMEAQANQKVVSQYLRRLAKIVQQNTPAYDDSSEHLNAITDLVHRHGKGENLHESAMPDSSIPATLAQASSYIDLTLQTFEKAEKPLLSKVQRLRVTFVLSETYEEVGNYDAAMQNYHKGLELATSLQDESTQGQIQYRIARLYSQRGKWDESAELLSAAQEKLKATGNFGEALLAQIELAQIDYRKGDYAAAQQLFEDALLKTDGIHDTRSRAVVNNHLGIICRMQENHDAAFWHFQQALIDFQTIQDTHGAAECMNNLGVVHLRRVEFERAKYYFDKALQLCQELSNFPLIAFVYSNKAELYTQSGDLAMAFSTCISALEHLISLGNPIGIAKVNAILARIFSRNEEPLLAEALFKESMRLYEEHQVPLGLANCYKDYADLLEETNRVSEAKEFETRARELFQLLEVQVNSKEKEPIPVTAEGAEPPMDSRKVGIIR